MRHVIKVLLLVSILVLIIQCSRQESISDLMGKTEIALPPDTLVYYTNPAQTDSLILYIDTLRWVYELPPGGPSSVSFIIRGQSQLDLEVEAFMDGAITSAPIVRDATGAFIDTIQVAVTPPSEEMLTDISEEMLTGSSRLFVKNAGEVLDVIPLDNPW